MSSNCLLLNLPDLVLHHICSFITCPFDLYNFGNTCSRLRNVTFSQSLWWSLSFRWFRGVWVHIRKKSAEVKPRDWLLELMRHYSKHSSCTKLECLFSNGERWQRVDSKKLRFLIGMIRFAYFSAKDDHPFVLYEQWLYDLGLYRRIEPYFDYSQGNLEFPENTILVLTALSQASERDLRRRKQPFKDPKYYIKHISSSKDWITDLFPTSLHGSICPLLICPLKDSLSNESSGLEGLSMCISIIIERHLQIFHSASDLHLKKLGDAIQLFQTLIISHLSNSFPSLENKFGKLSFKSAILILIEENSFELKELQNALDSNCLRIKANDVLRDLALFLKKSESIDDIVDENRSRLRKFLICEAERVLFDGPKIENVARINLTDSDIIGGDNSHQEMSAAAFISRKGVLVTWHLIGKMRY